jgi:predicted O-methyltransferase YrrM
MQSLPFDELFWLFNCDRDNRDIIRMDFDEAATLYQLAKHLGPGPVRGLEIGRWDGGSTFLIAAALPEDGKLISIDKDLKSELKAKTRLAEHGLHTKVAFITANSDDVNPCGPYDFIFIDGDHSYDGVKRDHLRFGAHVRVGGFIAHHDMARERKNATQMKGPAQLRSEIIANNSLQLYHEKGSLSIFKRVSEEWETW